MSLKLTSQALLKKADALLEQGAPIRYAAAGGVAVVSGGFLANIPNRNKRLPLTLAAIGAGGYAYFAGRRTVTTTIGLGLLGGGAYSLLYGGEMA